MPYTHRQIGTVTLSVMIGVLLLLALALFFSGAPLLQRILITGLIALVFAPFAILFSSLTISVDDHELRWAFGPGWPYWRVNVGDMEDATIVRNPVWYGWGIRVTPHGMLYNVSGRDAVEVRLRPGSGRLRPFRLGTDEPEQLRAALQAAMDKG